MRRWLLAAIPFLLCYRFASAEGPSSLDVDVEGCLQDSELPDDTSSVQLLQNKIELSKAEVLEGNYRPPLTDIIDYVRKNLYTGSVDKEVSFLPVVFTLGILGFFMVLWVVNSVIQAAFNNVPFLSSLLMFCLLGVLCFSMLPALWDLSAQVLSKCGIWVLLSTYLAVTFLVFMPIVMIRPDQGVPTAISDYMLGESPRMKTTQRIGSSKQALSMLYLIIFVLMIVSAVSIFLVAEAVGGGMVLSSMIAFLYLILAWSSLTALYEGMFPGSSFGADFPGQICGQAFLGITTTTGEEVPLGILNKISSVTTVYDDTKVGMMLFLIWALYGLAALISSVWLGVTICQLLYDADEWGLLYVTILICVCFVGLAIIFEISIHQGQFGYEADGSSTKTSYGGYLNGLLNKQVEIEARISQKLGKSSTDELVSKSDLAWTLFRRGDFASAEKLYRKVWEVRQQKLGPDHADTLTSKENLANAVLWCGDSPGAEKLYTEVWQTRQKILGPNHPDTLSSKYRLERCTQKIM